MLLEGLACLLLFQVYGDLVAPGYKSCISEPIHMALQRRPVPGQSLKGTYLVRWGVPLPNLGGERRRSSGRCVVKWVLAWGVTKKGTVLQSRYSEGVEVREETRVGTPKILVPGSTTDLRAAGTSDEEVSISEAKGERCP